MADTPAAQVDLGEADLDAVQNGVLIVDLPLRTLIVRGPDRVSWLNGLVTCELAKLATGTAAYGLIVAKNGKIQSEVYALLGAEDMQVGVRADKAEELQATLDKHLVMEDVELELGDPSDKWKAALGARAPEAVQVARGATARAGLVRRGNLD